MTRDQDPADTRVMGIVHAALRRDLERVREAVWQAVGEQFRP